ncbi:MAG TPA: UvrD-helicase domain-containing protein [Anaerolineae bacterium]|nr:UvrD-helicase domain-containing protein [Anaerolineae bacterium]
MIAYTALEQIDRLIAYWGSDWDSNEEFYLTNLVPGIVKADASVNLTGEEKKIIPELRKLLSEDEWSQLPTLIAQRRAHKLTELTSDRQRAEQRREIERQAAEEQARVKAEEERRQREAELERKQQEEQRRQVKAARLARKRGLLARIEATFISDFLSADAVRAADPDAELLDEREYEEIKRRFVRDWAARELSLTLDEEQAAAVAATGGDIQVTARAGSGKTRTLVTRAIFLQKHCHISPHALLLLAFNKKAVKEMKDRLAQVLGTALPHVMTFHALAHAIVDPQEKMLYDDLSAAQFGLSREVQEVIDEHIQSTDYRNCIQDLMFAYFREDWERIIDGKFYLAMDEFLSYRRLLPRESLKGDYVKSFGEKVIANTLFEYGVEYYYESNFPSGDGNYRPDFKIPDGAGGVIIEYFGLEGDADYDETSQWKRQFWAERPEWQFLEFSPRDFADGQEGFVQLLLRKLKRAGILCNRRSEEEIWDLIRARAIDGFTKAMTNFIGRCRRCSLTPEALEAMIARHTLCSFAEKLFLKIGVSVYRSYLQRLAANQEEDFDGLLWRAVSQIREGQTRFVRDKRREHGDVAQLQFVLIDEFQDFTPMFFALVEAIRTINSHVKFYCVGDDWQAINGFAGSDLRYFENFATYFQDTSQYHIPTNHRSRKAIVEVGNALMKEHGPAARPEQDNGGTVWVCDLDKFKPSASEQARHNKDEITPALLRLVSKFLACTPNVVILSRQHRIPWCIKYDEMLERITDPLDRFLAHIRSFLAQEDRQRVTISTTHNYKGLQQAGVIILDAIARRYPLIHPHWIFLRLFGDTPINIEVEERRLFYVAVTRAVDSLALVTEQRIASPYLADIRHHMQVPPFSWADLPPASSIDCAHLEIRVSGTQFHEHERRTQLKNFKYCWNEKEKYWYRTVMAENFSFDDLLTQPWVSNNITIEVYSEAEELLLSRPGT